MHTTLNKIRNCSPCTEGWAKLLATLGKTKADDEPLDFLTILESNGLDDALWCARSAPEYDKDWRLFAVWCARQVQHLMTDKRSIEALDVAEKFANGVVTISTLAAAYTAAFGGGISKHLTGYGCMVCCIRFSRQRGTAICSLLCMDC